LHQETALSKTIPHPRTKTVPFGNPNTASSYCAAAMRLQLTEPLKEINHQKNLLKVKKIENPPEKSP
tara:strand:+ start:2645 stop:2845 length:201 start_codon:yes stop_codon:yes gene_type:complete